MTLRSTDGVEFVGASGEDGLILVVRKNVRRMYTATLEDRAGGNRWAGRPRNIAKSAVANLHREVKRLVRAGGVK